MTDLEDRTNTKMQCLAEALKPNRVVPEDMVGTFHRLDDHWNNMNQRTAETRLPVLWASNFISIHYNQFNEKYTLIAPIPLIDEKLSTRPAFEHLKFDSYQESVEQAVELAKYTKTFVVACVDENKNDIHRTF